MGIIIAFLVGIMASKFFFDYQKIDLHEEAMLQVRLEEMEQSVRAVESLLVREFSDLKSELRMNHDRTLLESERIKKSIDNLERFLLVEIIGDDWDLYHDQDD